MSKLKLQIGGCPITDDEMETLADHYPLIDSATFLFKFGPAFLKLFDDEEATANEEKDNDVEDNVFVDEGNALMVFDGCDDDT